MLRRLLAGFLLLGGLLPGVTAATGPRFGTGLLAVDLGRVGPNSLNPFTFTLKNVGDAPLVIERVRTNCSCTEVKLSQEVIAPGGTARLDGTLKTTSAQGPMTRLIYLFTNDPDHRRVNLSINADVRSDIAWTPQSLHLDWPVPGNYQGRIVLTPAAGESAICRRVDSERRMLQPSLEKEGDVWVVRFTLTPGVRFQHSDTLRIETSSRDFPLIQVPVFFQRQTGLKVTPSSCFFSVERGAEVPAKRFVVSRKDGGEVSLKSVAGQPDFFKINVVQRRGKTVVIEVAPRPGLPPGSCDGSIVVRTEADELQIGISCQVNASEPTPPKS